MYWYIQSEIYHVFIPIVLPNITYALAVYGSVEPELTTAQHFIDRSFKKNCVSERIDIHQSLEKQNKNIFKKLKSIEAIGITYSQITEYWFW